MCGHIAAAPLPGSAAPDGRHFHYASLTVAGIAPLGPAASFASALWLLLLDTPSCHLLVWILTY